MTVQNPGQNYLKFQEEFLEALLATYRACQEIIKSKGIINTIKNHFRNHAALQIVNCFTRAVGVPLKAQGGALGQVGADMITNLGSAAALLYMIWQDKQEHEALAEAQKFLKVINVKNESEMLNLAIEISDVLYQQFRNGIEELYVAPGEIKGVVKLAKFFATAIAKDVMENNRIQRALINDKAKELAKSAIPNSLDKLYKSFISGNVSLETNIDNNNMKWTIKGLLLKAPAIIQGETTQLTNNQIKIRNRAPKYPHIIFVDKKQARSYGYNLSSPEELARVSDLTKASNKFSFVNTLTYYYNGECNASQRREDQLRIAVIDGDNKLDFISAMLEDKVSLVNINGRGMANSLCSIARGLYDKTPVMVAAANNQTQALQLLLDKGANFNLQDAWGYTALDYAVSHGHAAAADLLFGLHAKQNKTIQFDLDRLLKDNLQYKGLIV